MFRRAKETARGERGQNLLEFAVVALLLLLILAGIVDLGRAFYTYMAVANAAREGARVYSRLPCNADSVSQGEPYLAVCKATRQEALDNGLDLTGCNCSDVKVSCPGITLVPDPRNSNSCQVAGQPVRVTVVYTFNSMLGALPLLGGGDYTLGQLPLRYQATMVNFGTDMPSTPTP